MNVYICSRKEIQKLIRSGFPDNTAVISYFGEGERPVFFPPQIKHLRIYIDDISTNEVSNPNDYHINDFKNVAQFILECDRKNMNILCQCEAGISRSAATAAAILEFYEQKGIKVFSDYRYNPNKLFYNSIYRCLNEYKYDMPCLFFLMTKLNTSKVSQEGISILRELQCKYSLPTSVTNFLIEKSLEACDGRLVRAYILIYAKDIKNHHFSTSDEVIEFLKGRLGLV